MRTDADAAARAAVPDLVIRPYAGEADLPDVVRIQNAEWAADGVHSRSTLAELGAWWRRRGLARALIARSLRLLKERGMEVAALGVDADNPSGAFGLYESAGFAPTERFILWRKPMEAAR